jgi:hypothetical protein
MQIHAIPYTLICHTAILDKKTKKSYKMTFYHVEVQFWGKKYFFLNSPT